MRAHVSIIHRTLADPKHSILMSMALGALVLEPRLSIEMGFLGETEGYAFLEDMKIASKTSTLATTLTNNEFQFRVRTE